MADVQQRSSVQGEDEDDELLTPRVLIYKTNF